MPRDLVPRLFRIVGGEGVSPSPKRLLFLTPTGSWVRWDGEIWAIDTRRSAGWREYHEFARADEPSFGNPTPEFAASLPDHPDALRTYLDEHVSGSNVTIPLRVR